MSRTGFDQLPNELVCKIFDYLTATDAWYAFYDLNARLNALLQINQTNIDLSYCRKSQFDFICQCVLKKIENPFAIQFCPRNMEEDTHRVFSKLKSKNVLKILQSLTLINLTDKTFDIVGKNLHHFVNLHSLTILHDPEESKGRFIVKIMNINMPSLTYLKLGYTGRRSGLGFDENNLNKLRLSVPNVQEIVLQIPITVNVFYRFLSVLPKLVSIDVILMGRREQEFIDKPSSFEPATTLQKLVITMNGIIRFKIMAKFLRNLQQLCTFWFSAFICDNTCATEYQDGQVWEDLIQTYLPNLTDFRLNVGIEAVEFASPSDVIQSFCSPFWTEKKKWSFVADRPDNDVDTIELYSLPPPDQDKIIFRPNVPWASNCAEPNFNSIKTLEILPISNKSVSTTSKPRRYTNTTTIRSTSVYSFNHNYDVSFITSYVDLTKATKCIVNSSTFFVALPAMTNITSLGIQCYDGDTDCFKSIISPIHTVKKLILSESMNCYFCNLCDIDLITRIFPNLKYITVRICELDCVPILIRSLPHLAYAVIFNDPEAIDRKHLKKWLCKNEAMLKFTWALEGTRLDIWLN